MPDLPEISQNLDDPLPQVDPNSDLVPYRMSRTDPGGQPVVTTGYGPRGRPPIQPPESFGGGVGMPSLDQIYQAAFSKLPVGEAVQAVNAATKFIGQRMLTKALAEARTPEEMNSAYGRFGFLAFGNGAAVPEIMRAQIERERMNAPVIREAGGGLYRIPVKGSPETLVAPKPVPPKLHFNNTTGEIIQENPDGSINPLRPGTPRPKPLEPQEHAELTDAYMAKREATKDLVKANALPSTSKTQAKLKQETIDDASFRLREANKTIAKFNPASPPPMTPGQPAAPQVKVLPFPKSKAEAVKDAVYATKNGPMRWNGERFVPVQ